MPLTGVQVVEFAEGIAGPYAAKVLADMGADVIKVEPPFRGDRSRHAGPFPGHEPHPEHSGQFLYLNTNKLGVTLDVNQATGAELFAQLITRADVLIEDCEPGWLAVRGLGYDDLRQHRDTLVMTSLTRFGQDGPESAYKGYPLTTSHAGVEAYSLPGRLSLDMFPDRPPVQTGGGLGEYDSGLCAAVATLGALFSGVGQHLDVSQQEALMNINRPTLAHYFATGGIVSRQRGYEFGGALPCRDGYVLCRPIEDNHWQAVVRAMERPELAEDERFDTRQARTANGAALNELLLAWTMQHDKIELYERVAAEGAPIGYFATAEDVVEARQIQARGFIVSSDYPELGEVKLPSAPYQFSRTPWQLRRPAPRLGQHNTEVWCKRLGLAITELPRLRRTGVI
ncbi:MAG: hypothetical protein ETSY1_12605 [Candidatus Entotheonella factor]|uniref:Acyl-CoA transferase n=1 Tax=Entotheonella factor TaxID=1429438 RepID=W4LRQ2_ENTF1|nr:CoA transferase [Candidatus Entotheonella palauensis]ETX00072.1 MAG: hypothetical protein ETSY1_12605 [Candidatus Entotheonella factor]